MEGIAVAGRRILFMSTAKATTRYFSTMISTTSTVTEQNKSDSLYRRLLALGGTDANAGETLDQWVKEGKLIKKHDIVNFVNQLRKFKRYNHAIQLHEWMNNSMFKMSNGDCAIHIDLLAKTQGLYSAEKYFDTLEGTAKTRKTYGALLSCYVTGKMLDKASQLFEKIKELNFNSTLCYNNMMSLYIKTSQPDKVPLLAKELEENNIAADTYTYNLLINGYASLKNLGAVDEVVQKMKANKVKFDWFTYGNLATIYTNAGLLDKASAVLQEIENMENLSDSGAFHTLIISYAQASDLSGVNRAWESLKSNFPNPSNVSYLTMLLALSKLGNVEALERCFAEWESGHSNYDVRLANVMLETHLKRNMIREADLLYEDLVKRGAEPNLTTLELFMNFHIKNQHADLALKFLEMGASKANPVIDKWFPRDETVGMFLKHFKEKYDADRVEKFCNYMKKIDRLDSTVYGSLLHTNIAAV